MPMEWKTSSQPADYEETVAFMEARACQIREGTADELVWLLDHPPLYTAGTSANPADLIDTLSLPVHKTGRGGQYTYHGPGQRIAYVMLDLKKRSPDVRLYVRMLEEWLVASLAEFGVEGFTRPDRVGVWVEAAGGEKKIAALGVRIRQWVTYHGVSLNVNPDLTHYRGIVPCGISEYGVTSLEALGVHATMTEVDRILAQTFDTIFNKKASS